MTDVQEKRGQTHVHPAMLWSLLFGNFVTGTSVLLPAGMLTELASGLGIAAADAGALMLVSGLVTALGAPLLAAATNAIDRQRLLAASAILFAVAHAASAFAVNLEMLLLARIGVGVAAAVFTPQAAATVGALLAADDRPAAITMIFVGWSLATVAGIPMAGYLAHAMGWQSVYGIAGVISAISAVLVWMTVPAGIKIPPLSSQSWGHVLKSPALMLVLLVTVLNGAGQFTLYTYLSPSLRASLDAGAGLVTGILAWFGMCAIVGNVAANKIVRTLGPDRTAHMTLAAMAIALAIWGIGANWIWAVLAAAALWGAGNFATQSVQQARLAMIAPPLTSASMALNTSAIFIGQATGSALGAVLIKAGMMPALPFAGSLIMMLALAVSFLAARQSAP